MRPFRLGPWRRAPLKAFERVQAIQKRQKTVEITVQITVCAHAQAQSCGQEVYEQICQHPVTGGVQNGPP